MNFVHCVRVRSTPYKGDKISKGVFFFVPSSQNDRKKCPYLPKGQFLKKNRKWDENENNF